MSIGKRIKLLRENEGLNQVNLGKIIGVSDKAVSAWETDKKIPRMGKLQALADYFGVPKSYIIDGDQDAAPAGRDFPLLHGISRMPDARSIPRIGTVNCYHPLLAQENIAGYDAVPGWVQCDFSLICKDDSMTGAGIYNGSIVFIKAQDKVNQGQVAAVLIDNEPVIRRVRYIDGGVVFWPENSKYDPMICIGKNVNKVRILGLATHCVNKLK